MTATTRRAACLLTLLTAVLGAVRSAHAQELPLQLRPPTIHAPEFPDGREWLNTDHPVRLADLRGKVVLLDFWTYCCINCMHTLPELHRLKAAYPDSVVVVGVHSGKFAEEGDTENIRQAVLRYDIEHPVCVDTDMLVWSSYAVRAWPTLVLIDPAGYVADVQAGETTFAQLKPRIDAVLARANAAGSLRRSPVSWHLERDRQPSTLLRFPGKVLADAAADRLVIADSGHHRYVVTTLAGAVQDVIGSGEAGFSDGSFETARFRHPQGAARLGDKLYLADTENHALRVADLHSRTVTTLVGNGVRAPRPNQAGQGVAAQLASPWDVVVHEGRLLVANAGSHQIWQVDPATGAARPFAGSAREDLVDGPAFIAMAGALGADVTHGAALAQTSGLAVGGERLYFADSETSSVRWLNLHGEPAVHTLVGEGLFQFGDVDGRQPAARLQHCLGVAWLDGQLYVADTYNNKIRRLDPATGELTTLAGDGQEGDDDGALDEAAFDEPGGITAAPGVPAAPGALFVADTNNHAIRRIDLATGHVSTLALSRPERAAPRPLQAIRYEAAPAVRVRTGEVQLQLTVEPLQGYHLNPLAPLTLQVTAEDDQGHAGTPLIHRIQPALPTVRVALPDATPAVRVEVEAYLCTETGSGACLVMKRAWRVPLTRAADGEAVMSLALRQGA